MILSEILKTVLQLSVSGIIITIALLTLMPFIEKKFSKKWLFYIWVIVFIKLIIPYSPPINVIQGINNIIVHYTGLSPQNSNFELFTGNLSRLQLLIEQNTGFLNFNPFKQLNMLHNNFPIIIGLVWLFVCISMLIKTIAFYNIFILRLKSGLKPVTDDVILNIYNNACNTLKINRKPPLYINSLAISPMCAGFFKPCIILPDKQHKRITDLWYVFMHELTHYKRFDIYYKWFTQIIKCVHWFNPFVYIAIRKVNKYCELSCDEAVLFNSDNEHRIAYGNTLLNSFEQTSKFCNSFSSPALAENSKLLKERLNAILTFRKKNRANIFLSVLSAFIILTFALCTGVSVNRPLYTVSNVNSLMETLSIIEEENDTLTYITELTNIQNEQINDVEYIVSGSINNNIDNINITIALNNKDFNTSTITDCIKVKQVDMLEEFDNIQNIYEYRSDFSDDVVNTFYVTVSTRDYIMEDQF